MHCNTTRSNSCVWIPFIPFGLCRFCVRGVDADIVIHVVVLVAVLQYANGCKFRSLYYHLNTLTKTQKADTRLSVGVCLPKVTTVHMDLSGRHSSMHMFRTE